VYEPRNEAHEFIGDDQAEATRKAVAFFGIGEEALTLCALEGTTVYGLSGRVVVVAAPKDRAPVRRSSEGGAPREREGRDRESRGGRREGRREGGRREGREGREGREPRGESSREREAFRAAEPAPVRELSSEPSVGQPKGALSALGEFVRGTIERIDVGPFEIGESEDDEVVVFEVTGAAARALAGGDGRAVDALALIVNQAAQQGNEDAKKVVLDVEGNTEAREDFLARLTQRAISRARDAGRAIALDPMNGRDRRIIHLAVREAEGVASMSVGEGRYRQVVVVPEGAPEYEEALRQSEAVSQRD
jgi:predicted RNA-binding protein Jag